MRIGQREDRCGKHGPLPGRYPIRDSVKSPETPHIPIVLATPMTGYIRGSSTMAGGPASSQTPQLNPWQGNCIKVCHLSKLSTTKEFCSFNRTSSLSTMQSTGTQPKIIVGIVGAGISGLAVANGLLNDPGLRYDVQVYERDTIAFDSECGGYQIHIASNGLIAL